MHIYVEGFGDKWAIPLKELEIFKSIDIENELIVLREFISYCNIKECILNPSLENF